MFQREWDDQMDSIQLRRASQDRSVLSVLVTGGDSFVQYGSARQTDRSNNRLGALIGMIVAYKTGKSQTADRVALVAGILGLIIYMASAGKDIVSYSSAVGWNRVPHLIGFFITATYGFGALCLIVVGLCGKKAKSLTKP